MAAPAHALRAMHLSHRAQDPHLGAVDLALPHPQVRDLFAHEQPEQLPRPVVATCIRHAASQQAGDARTVAHMARVEVPQWVCDLCGGTDEVMTYPLRGTSLKLEACDSCGDDAALVLQALEARNATANG